MSDKLDLVIDRIDDLKEATNDRLDSIDENLREHMRRTAVLEDLHIDNQIRINKLEEPKKALLMLKSMVLYISSIAGAILVIMKLMEK